MKVLEQMEITDLNDVEEFFCTSKVIPATSLTPINKQSEVMFNEFFVMEDMKLFKYLWLPQSEFTINFSMSLICQTCDKTLYGVYDIYNPD